MQKNQVYYTVMEQFRSSWPQPENDPGQNPGQFEHALNPEKEAEKLKKDEKKRQEEETKKKQQGIEKHKTKKTEKDTRKKGVSEKEAETGKAKVEKREGLVGKSRELTQKYEDEPIPRDPAIVARLLIAQHILSLNDQLETSNLANKGTKSEALLASLEYMGELAEKLQDPLKEVGADIEAASALLLNLAAAALGDTEPEVLTQQNEAVTKQYLEIIAESGKTGAALEIELYNRAKAPIPPLVQHILTLRRNATTLPNPTPLASDSDGGAPIAVVSTASPEVATRSNKSPSSVPETQQSKEMRPTASPLAPFAATAAIADSLHRERTSANSAPLSETLVSPTREDILHAALPLEPVPENFETPDILPARRNVNKPAEVTLFPATPDQPRLIFPEASPNFIDHEASSAELVPPREPVKSKLEHLPLTTLLTMAETVSVGYGRYLRREFEAGHIDKEGLIRVLKSHSKGKDFLVEFQTQAVRFQTLKATSPEFLTSTPPPLPSEPLTTAFSPPSTPPKHGAQTRDALPRPVPQTTESKVAKEQPSTDLQQKLDQVSNKTWIAAIALASVILLLLILSLMR